AVADDLQRSTRELGPAPSCVPCLTLLPVGFTVPVSSPRPRWSLTPPFHPYRPARGRGGGLLSVALSRGSLRVGVTHHRAGWSPDFPRPRGASRGDAAARPTGPPSSLRSHLHLPLPREQAPAPTCRSSRGALPRPCPATSEDGLMLILLPPSEPTTRPAEVGHRPLALDELAPPALREARGPMLRAAHPTAAGSDAASRLGVPASSPELVGRMLHLEQEPAAAPLAVYSGVLYDQLEAGQAPVEGRDVLIQSALFGLVDAFRDRIPAYRLSAGSALSRLGRAGSWWGRQLRPMAQELRAEQAESGSPLIIDCRS